MSEPIEIYRGYEIFERTKNKEIYLQAIQKDENGAILDKYTAGDSDLNKLREVLDERFLYHYKFSERELMEAADIHKIIRDISYQFKSLYGRFDDGLNIYSTSENKRKDTYLYSAGGDCYDSVVAVENADTHEFDYYTVHVEDRGYFYIRSFEDSYKKFYHYYPKKLAYIYSAFKSAFHSESYDENQPVFALYKDYIVQVHSAENDKYWLQPIYSLPDTTPAYDSAIENKEPVFHRVWSNTFGYMYRRIFETERLILRPWVAKEDAESLYQYAKDPAVGPIAGWPVHTSVENSRDIINQVLSDTETYAVCLKENNVAIGSIGLIRPAQSHTKANADELEIGYWIGVPFWGQGLIPEAVRVLQEHAFCNLGCSALWCGYYDGNEKSKRCQEKCGFTYHHTEENKPCVLMGDVRTEHFTRITKKEWEKLLGISGR